MKNYYQPTKMNLASFANMLPRVHLHVMARYENDSYFPNPMWGEKLREADLKLPNKEILSRSSMLNILKVHLAGMAILDLKYKEWHTNIKDDLEKSKALAKKMVYE